MIWPKRKARVSFWQQAFQLKLIRGHLRLSNFRFHRKLLRLYPAAVLHRLKLNFDVMVKDVWQGAKSVKWNDQETDHQVPMNFLFLKFKKKIYSSHKIKIIYIFPKEKFPIKKDSNVILSLSLYTSNGQDNVKLFYKYIFQDIVDMILSTAARKAFLWRKICHIHLWIFHCQKASHFIHRYLVYQKFAFLPPVTSILMILFCQILFFKSINITCYFEL